MQDPRLRIASILLLSFASFLHIAGALATIAWWLVFTRRTRSLPSTGMIAGIATIVVVVAVIKQMLTGDGIYYIVQMSAIFLLCGWLYHEWQGGEMLDVSIWMLGHRIGFEVGLIAEMGMQTIRIIEQDIERYRLALRLKGRRWGFKSGIVVATNLILGLLDRAENQAKLLAVRGYRHGGSHCSGCTTTVRDLIATGCACCITLGVLIMLVMFFIVIQ